LEEEILFLPQKKVAFAKSISLKKEFSDNLAGKEE
jgi:hypothetical protein